MQKQLKYSESLDGVRAIAVLFVISTHWFPGGLSEKIGLGSIGVDIFFVLSGFLITRILLVERLNYESNPTSHSRFNAIRNFMIRRFLRIFPIYYIMLFLLILFKNQFPNPVFLDWKWYFFYLQNILFYINQAWPGGKLSHLWSLAVEEQFYLFWPWVILFVSQKWLLKIISSFFFIGIICVYISPQLNLGYNADLLTPSCMHAFAAGGILAYFNLYMKNTFKVYNLVFRILGLWAFGILVLGKIGLIPSMFDLRTLISIITVGLISSILYNPSAIFFKHILGNLPIVFLGKISYGVYLFHNFIPILFNAILHKLEKYNFKMKYLNYEADLYNQNFLFYSVSFFILLALASLSFKLIEAPINNLKNKFY